MGLRFRKTIKIAPGIKLNLSKSGVSTTIGKRGASVNIGKRGVYANAGIPGTGVSYRQKIGGGKSSSRKTEKQEKQGAARNAANAAPDAVASAPKKSGAGKKWAIGLLVLFVLGVVGSRNKGQEPQESPQTAITATEPDAEGLEPSTQPATELSPEAEPPAEKQR